MRAGKIVPAVGNTANVCPGFSINLIKRVHQQLFHSPALDIHISFTSSVLSHRDFSFEGQLHTYTQNLKRNLSH